MLLLSGKLIDISLGPRTKQFFWTQKEMILLFGVMLISLAIGIKTHCENMGFDLVFFYLFKYERFR